MAEQVLQMQDPAQWQALCGNFDENIRTLEQLYTVTIVCREAEIKVHGTAAAAAQTVAALQALLRMLEAGQTITLQTVHYVASMVEAGETQSLQTLTENGVCLTATGKVVRARTVGQKQYVAALQKNTIVFGIGPAGTGKTYLAVAMAVKAFRQHLVNRIILTRPAVEAGEKLGFLPGDLQDKVDPYLRPLYDALFEMMGAEVFQRNLERGVIEVAPLAYMRGRTLDHAFIILDEAQNTTSEQLKMFLTRLGEESRMVITGDITQIDLPDKRKSGLLEAMHVLQDVEEIAIQRFTEKDVVRHHLVQEIIRAYEAYGQTHHNNNEKKG
jgi:phosphate starvation-inducible PhoH-like protein